jgi:hypothetical protein
MPSTIDIGPINVSIAAPRYLVFQVLRSLGDTRDSDEENEVRVVHEDESRRVVEFQRTVKGKRVRAVEEIVYDPPDRVTFQHVEGPYPEMREEMTLEDDSGKETSLVYKGSFTVRDSLFGRVFGRLFLRTGYTRQVLGNLRRLKEAAERIHAEQQPGRHTNGTH